MLLSTKLASCLLGLVVTVLGGIPCSVGVATGLSASSWTAARTLPIYTSVQTLRIVAPNDGEPILGTVTVTFRLNEPKARSVVLTSGNTVLGQIGPDGEPIIGRRISFDSTQLRNGPATLVVTAYDGAGIALAADSVDVVVVNKQSRSSV